MIYVIGAFILAVILGYVYFGDSFMAFSLAAFIILNIISIILSYTVWHTNPLGYIVGVLVGSKALYELGKKGL